MCRSRRRRPGTWGHAAEETGLGQTKSQRTGRAPGGHAALEAPGSREKILDVAEALFARRGYAGVGLSEVARAVGLGKSSLFHHFRSKVQLYLEVLGRVLGRIDERLQPALAAGGGPSERLLRALDALVDALAEHPTSARLLLRGLFEDDAFPDELGPEGDAVDRRLAGLIGGIEALLHEGIAQGAFRQVSIPHMMQTLIGVTVYHFASGEFGEGLIGGSLFSAEQVRRRKEELRGLLYHGLTA